MILCSVATARNFHMTGASWNTKLAILWLIQAVNAIGIVEVSRIENVPGLIAFEGSSGVLAITLAIFCGLAWFSAEFPARITRWPNLVCGLLVIFFKSWALLNPFFIGLGEEIYSSWVINEVIGLLLGLPIIWYAWKAPKLDPRFAQ